MESLFGAEDLNVLDAILMITVSRVKLSKGTRRKGANLQNDIDDELRALSKTFSQMVTTDDALFQIYKRNQCQIERASTLPKADATKRYISPYLQK